MYTRARIAAGSAVAGALLVGAVAIAGPAQSPPMARAAASDAAGQELLQVPPQPSPSPGPRGPRHHKGSLTPEQRQQMRQQFISRLAANLGVSESQLTDALKRTRIDMVNQAVQDGRVSREQADQIIQRINSGQGPARSPHPSPSPR